MEGHGVNYYERHLGDYARDTAHLTMMEHGAYGLLLDRYYSTEAGIPADQVHRLARVRTPAERAAVDAVLTEFFVLVDGLWINGRASREIEKAQSKINAARKNGTRGGRPKRNPTGTYEKPTGLSVGSENETQAKAHQTPDTRYQIPDKETHTPEVIDAEPREATAAGRVCRLMRQAGIGDTNPGHPMLLALLDAGCSDAEFAGAAATAVDREKGFCYAIGMIRKQREEAAAAVLHQGEMPQRMSPGQAAAHARIAAAAPSLLPRKTQTLEAVDVAARRMG